MEIRSPKTMQYIYSQKHVYTYIQINTTSISLYVDIHTCMYIYIYIQIYLSCLRPTSMMALFLEPLRCRSMSPQATPMPQPSARVHVLLLHNPN